MKLSSILGIIMVTFCNLVQAQYASHKTMPDPTRQVKTDMKDWSFKLSTTISTFDLKEHIYTLGSDCLLYTSPSPRDLSTSRMPSSA